MMRTSLLLAAFVATTGNRPPSGRAGADAAAPFVQCVVHVDPAQLDVVDVAIRIANAPSSVRLAMKVHPEYDARYWRYLDALHVDGTTDDTRARVVRVDTTLWTVTLPGGHGIVHYRVHVQPSGATRRAWMPFMRVSGGLINPPDFFLYLPDFPQQPVGVQLDVPRDWRVATALATTRVPNYFIAHDAATLLDSPILLGAFRLSDFTERDTRFHVAYWPLPEAATFDTAAFVARIHRLTNAALDVFGSAPTKDYWFLLQDGASDALEHRASLTLGVSSEAIARDPRAGLPELAHELFHAWNLVAIHPDAYNQLSYQRPVRTTGLWWSEGVTLYYADALLRRAGLADPTESRLVHLQRLLARYYSAPWNRRVSPEASSLAMGDSPARNPNATGGYYLQGELLAFELDAVLRDSTRDRKGLDAVMRALYAESASGAGFSGAQLARTMEAVCGCRLRNLFAHQVRTPGLIDVRPTLARIGYRLVVDTVPAVDADGRLLPDLRLSVDFSQPSPPVRLVIPDPTSVWSASGLRTGDVVLGVNGAPVSNYFDMMRVLRTYKVGDTLTVAARRDSLPLSVAVRITGYRTPRVRFAEHPHARVTQQARRSLWLNGW